MPTLLLEPSEVADYLGRDLARMNAVAVAQHLEAATAMVHAYTRGGGFDEQGRPAQDLAHVIVTTVARTVDNPEHFESRTVGDVTDRWRFVNGWTLPELAILHRYRRRLA